MKKLLLILICVLVVSAIALPTFVVAESKTANDVHFISPTGLALVGDYLLVSDNVADNQSAILCFDIGAGANAHKFTYLLDKQAVSLSASEERLFVVFADSFAEYAMDTQSNTLTLVQSYNQANVIDVCIGKLDNDDVIYFVQTTADGDTLKCVMPNGTIGSTNMKVAKAFGILPLSDGTNDYIYIAGKNSDGTNSITRWGCKPLWDIAGDALNQNGVRNYAQNFELKGIATNNRNYPVVYGAKSMYNLNEDGNDGFIAEQGFADFSSQTHNIIKVATSQTHLVILNSNNQLLIYNLDGTTLGTTSGVIGSDQVSTPVPTTYTGFTLAKSSGYPTNIIYKTANEDTSIQSILTKDQVQEFIILDYEGATNSSYYYVFVNGRFGWSKKSDNATTPDTDDKIDIVDTSVSGVVTYNAKFNSLGKVYVYDLPCSNDNIRKPLDTVSQSGNAQIEVTILQQFREGDIIWYYVEYLQGKRGFVKSSDVGQFTATYVGPTDAVVDKKINASLFNAVTIHTNKSLSEDTILTVDGVNPIKLYSGDWVKVLEVDEQAGATLIQLVMSNGTTTFGWVDSARLCDLTTITTSDIVGLSALGLAIALAVVFTVVFVKRKKSQKK